MKFMMAMLQYFVFNLSLLLFIFYYYKDLIYLILYFINIAQIRIIKKAIINLIAIITNFVNFFSLKK